MKQSMGEGVTEQWAAWNKVHRDQPVKNYRWLGGFNEYGNLQASGVSGQGGGSFYYPPNPSTCSECHMPLVASHDPGNRNGMVHSHRFAAANTAIAYVNRDEEQLQATEKFLQSGFITVDLFAATPVEEMKGQTEIHRRSTDAPALASTFAVGEEAEQTGPAVIREVGKIAAPIGTPGVRFQPGSTVRVDAVVP